MIDQGSSTWRAQCGENVPSIGLSRILTISKQRLTTWSWKYIHWGGQRFTQGRPTSEMWVFCKWAHLQMHNLKLHSVSFYVRKMYLMKPDESQKEHRKCVCAIKTIHFVPGIKWGKHSAERVTMSIVGGCVVLGSCRQQCHIATSITVYMWATSYCIDDMYSSFRMSPCILFTFLIK